MADWFNWIPPMVGALAVGLLLATLAALLTRHRGGRFRGLLGWVGFWVIFGGILVGLSAAPRWVSVTLLGLLMYAALRTYFFLAPMRPQDRYAILAAYLAIPFALYPGYAGATTTFLATVPVVLFLLFPVLLSIGPASEGLLDSMGRLLLGVLIFVFCAAHLALMAQWPAGQPEFFGVLVLAAELPLRLSGRYGPGTHWARPSLGVAGALLIATVIGFWLAPWAGLGEEDGARAGLLVAIAVTMGSLVSAAVTRDLALGTSVARGRGAFLDRAIPVVYAAPVFFHYLNHFA